MAIADKESDLAPRSDGRLLTGKIIDRMRTRIRYTCHPRALLWWYYQKRCPAKPLIASLRADLKVRIHPQDVIGRYIYIDGVFETIESEFVRSLLQSGMTVFDLGANIGQYTLLAARSVGPTGKVHSFEPSRRMFDELCFNVGLNDMSQICVLNHVAISDRRGHALLSRHAPGEEVFGSLAPPHRSMDRSVVGYEEVETTTLDEYVRENGISHVDFMKVDIEGAELLALQGARQLLSGRDGPTILVELADVTAQSFGHHALDLWDFLSDFGYRMYWPGAVERGLRAMERPCDFSVAANVVARKR